MQNKTNQTLTTIIPTHSLRHVEKTKKLLNLMKADATILTPEAREKKLQRAEDKQWRADEKFINSKRSSLTKTITREEAEQWWSKQIEAAKHKRPYQMKVVKQSTLWNEDPNKLREAAYMEAGGKRKLFKHLTPNTRMKAGRVKLYRTSERAESKILNIMEADVI
jgi:hypothetical protein